ncbi:hypothetical protein MCOR04_010870 [Pyricularia oryzae]|nr:hypothetical protein MCOR04_010870 [Pyricularia oryzae]
MDQPVNQTSIRCIPCARLSVESLVELARIEFEAHIFPQNAYYQHHASFDDLEASANNGCDFCGLILECFQQSISKDKRPLLWPYEWDPEQPLSRPTGSDTMYAVAKSLSVSDIKLCVNATHLYLGQGIKEARVFDEILVQVGPLPAVNDDDVEPEWSMPQLRLTLESPRDEKFFIGDFRVGRLQLDTNLGSASNHMLARQWLSDCRLHHGSCLTEKLYELPTRVIDVGDSLESSSVSLFLSRGFKADYAALSHCWGGAISPLLTTETMHAFQECIQIATLPANFRDAITITRNLGIRYLWIDSLCIQQDSKSDWERESKMMGSVYRNSTVTISAMVSSGSKEGILKCDTRVAKYPKGTSLPLSCQGNESCSECPQVTVYPLRDPNQETIRGLDLGCALTYRGWTLQEYLLSPRHIMYNKDMLYWRCPGTFLSSDGLPPGNRTPDRTYPTMSRVIYSDILHHNQPPASDMNILFVEYYQLLGAYSARRLTYGSDKLPAFSGLAQRLHPVMGGDYLAGIWTTDFRRGLMWTADPTHCPHAEGDYRAPSWSWAVTDEQVLYGSGCSSTLEPSPSSANLIDYSVEPRVPGNQYGEIRSASIVLEALTKPLVRSSQVVNGLADPDGVGVVIFDESPVSKDSLRMTHTALFQAKAECDDYLLSVITRPGADSDWEIDDELFVEQDYLLLLVHTDDNAPEDPESSNSGALCLVVRPVGGNDHSSDTFERMGTAFLGPPSLEWLKTWRRRVLTLV